MLGILVLILVFWRCIFLLHSLMGLGLLGLGLLQVNLLQGGILRKLGFGRQRLELCRRLWLELVLGRDC